MIRLPFIDVAVLCGCVGCGDGLVDVKAKVLLDGAPIDGAAVTLHPVTAQQQGLRSASGISETDGTVRFTTNNPFDGVAPGEYKVVVLKSPKDIDDEFAGADRNDPEVMLRMAQRRSLAFVPYSPTVLPKIYLDQKTTPLSIRVAPGQEPITIELQSDTREPRR